jgi:hypothetical protein
VIDVLCICDTHAGSAAGLTPPAYQYNLRDDDAELDAAAIAVRQLFARVQRVLWGGYLEILDEFGPVDIVAANADLTDGSRFETIQHITTDSELQARIAIEALSAIKFRGAPDWRFTYGTPVHTVNGWNHEHLIADELGGPISDTLKLRLNGLNIQWRHHQGRSDIPTGQGAQLSREVVRDILRSSIYQYPAADVVVRSHAHYWYHLAFAGKEAFSLPSLEVPLSIYGRRLRTMYYDMGLVRLRVSKGGILDYQKRLIPLRLVLDEEYLPIEDRGEDERGDDHDRGAGGGVAGEAAEETGQSEVAERPADGCEDTRGLAGDEQEGAREGAREI